MFFSSQLEDDHSSMHGLLSPQQSAHDYLTGLIYLTLYHHHRLSTFYPRRAWAATGIVVCCYNYIG